MLGNACLETCHRVCCDQYTCMQGPKFGPRPWKNGAEVRRWLAELAPQGDRSAPEHSVHNPVQLQRCRPCALQCLRSCRLLSSWLPFISECWTFQPGLKSDLPGCKLQAQQPFLCS